MADISQNDFQLKSVIDDPNDVVSGVDNSEVIPQPQIADVKIPVGTLLQQVGAKAEFTADQTVPDDNAFHLPTQDGDPVFDTGSHFTAARYTVGQYEAGIYLLVATLRMYSPTSAWASTELAIGKFFKNGSELADGSISNLFGSGNATKKNIVLQELVSLDDGDIVDVRVESQIVAADLSIAAFSSLAVVRIGAPIGAITGPS